MAQAHTIPRTFALLGALALAGAGLAACAPEPTPTPTATDTSASASPSSTASSTPDASRSPGAAAADLDWPDTTLPTQVAVALFNPPGSDPAISTGQSIAGPATVEVGRTLVVTSDCVGDRLSYELRTATADEDQRVIASDTIVCGPSSRMTFRGLDYAGVVQLSITDATDADAAWVQAVLEP